METPMDNSLDSILGDNAQAAETVTTAAQAEGGAAGAEGENKIDTGEPVKAEDGAGTPPAEKQKAEKTETDKAFATIRRELKAAKRASEELQRQLTARDNPPEIIDPVLDHVGFSKSIDQKIHSAVSSTRIAVMDELAAEKYDDYEEMRDLFIEQASDNPELRQEMTRAKNPAEFAYKFGKEFKVRQEIGDPVQYAEKIRQETVQKAMADLDKIVEAKVKERLSGLLPSSLAETQTQGGRANNPSGYNGPTSLDSILNSK
jgi:hypothetical protein